MLYLFLRECFRGIKWGTFLWHTLNEEGVKRINSVHILEGRLKEKYCLLFSDCDNGFNYQNAGLIIICNLNLTIDSVLLGDTLA